MSPDGQSNLLLIRRLLHPATPDFEPGSILFPSLAQVLGREKARVEIAHQRIAMRGPESKEDRMPNL